MDQHTRTPAPYTCGRRVLVVGRPGARFGASLVALGPGAFARRGERSARGLRHARHGRQGVVAAWVLIAIVVMLISVGFGADFPRVLLGVQRTQDVCDAAVLAGASVLPDGSAAYQEVLKIVAANSPAGSSYPVTIDPALGDLATYGPGDSVPGFRVLASGERVMYVRAHTYVPYYFLPIVGRRGVSVTRVAMALYTEASGVACIFSKDEYESQRTSDWGVLITGSGCNIDGRIHANGKIKFTGSGHTVTKTIEYRGELRTTGSGIDFQGGSVVGNIEPYPINYQWTDFPYSYSCSTIKVTGSGKTVRGGASRVHVNGDLTVTGSGHTFPPNTTYLVEGDVNISGSGHSLDGITIIAKGSIDFNGSGCACDINPNEPGIFLISYESGSNQPSISFNGSGHSMTGIVFAPTGDIDFNGSGQMVYQGSLVGQAITVNGSGFTCRGTDVGGATKPTVQLIR